MGIPIPKTLRIWTSLSHITLAIWVRVRAIGEAHIRAPFPGLGGGAPHLQSQGKAPLGTRLVLRVFPFSASGGRKNGNEEYF